RHPHPFPTRRSSDLNLGGGIVMDVSGVEQVNVNALNGQDQITVNDLTNTEVTGVNVDLENLPGSGSADGLADRVNINGSAGDDRSEEHTSELQSPDH